MSETTATDNAIQYQPRTGRSIWSDAARRILRDPSAVICLLIILFYAGIAIYAGIEFEDYWITTHDYSQTNEPPSLDSWRTWLGTDWSGRSVLIKTMLGAKISMTIGFVAMLIAIPFGMILGALAGYYGKFLDDGIVWLYTTLAAIPGLIRVIAIKFAFQDTVLFQGAELFGRSLEIDLGGLPGIILALAITGWIGTCRLVRAETLKVRELDYVLAAKAAGRRGPAILFAHVLPNVMHIGIINFTLGFVGCVAAEVALSYLNLGVPDLPSWGAMINSAREGLIVGRWWQITAAGVAMFLLVLAMNIFGDRLRDALDPKLRNL